MIYMVPDMSCEIRVIVLRGWTDSISSASFMSCIDESIEAQVLLEHLFNDLQELKSDKYQD